MTYSVDFRSKALKIKEAEKLTYEETAKRFREVITPLILRLEALYDTC